LEAEDTEAVIQENGNDVSSTLDSLQDELENESSNACEIQQGGSESRAKDAEILEPEESEGSFDTDSDMDMGEYETDDGFQSGYESDEEPFGIARAFNDLTAPNNPVLGLQQGHPSVQQSAIQSESAGNHLHNTSASQLLFQMH
jgi:hypothetical protein